MDALEAIFTRRSIRQYTEQPLAQPVIDNMLKAAMLAPSAMDQRPWHFVVIEDRKILLSLADKMPHCEMLTQATCGIMILGDPTLQKLEGFWEQDCSACAENILLAAHAMGLGAVWLAAHPIEDRISALRQVLNIPQQIIPFALISIGYPAEQHSYQDRFDQSRVHRNSWSDVSK